MREDLAEENLTSFLVFYIYRYFSLGGDLEDLEVALGAPDEVKSRVLGRGSCSAIIKLLPDKSELLLYTTRGDRLVTWCEFTSVMSFRIVLQWLEIVRRLYNWYT